MARHDLGDPAKSLLFALIFALLGFASPAQTMMRAGSTYDSGQPAAAPGNAAAGGSAGAGGAGSMQAATQLSGSIASINGSTLFLTLKEGGTIAVALGPATSLLARVPVRLAEIRAGDALGVAATKGADGSLTATSISVFSAAIWERARKGQFPMANGELMTNAQVQRLAASPQGQTLYLAYDMLSVAVFVPAATPVRKTQAIGLGDLRPGLAVTARGATDSSGLFQASSLLVEQP